MPFISVILPIYKVEKYIEQCINSIINQTFRDFELILVDDCTPDHSMQIAMKLASGAADIPVLALRTPVNSGQSVARNMAMDKAKGEYIFFTDSDDYLTPDCLEKLTKCAEKYPDADIVYGSGHVFCEDGSKPWQHVEETLDLIGRDMPDYYATSASAKKAMLKERLLPAYPWNKLIRRKFLNDYNLRFRRGILAQDLHLNFFMAKKVRAIALCKHVTYHYRFHHANSTLARNQFQRDCLDWIYCDWLKHLDRRCLPAQIELILHRAHSSYVESRGDKPLQSIAVRYPASIFHLIKLYSRYRNNLPVEHKL